MGKIEKIKLQNKRSYDREIFCLLSTQGQKQDKKLVVQVLLAHLPAPQFFTGLPRFCLVLESSALIVGLAIGLAISRAEFVNKKIAIGFSRYSLWKVITSFRRCWIANADSQVFFSSGYSF